MESGTSGLLTRRSIDDEGDQEDEATSDQAQCAVGFPNPNSVH